MKLFGTILIGFFLFSTATGLAQSDELSSKKKMRLTRTFIDAGKEKNLGNQQAALELYQQCIQIDPKNDASYYEIGQIFQEQQRSADAEKMFKKATELDPENEWYQLRLGDALDAQGKFRESSEVWQKLQESDPRNPNYIDRYGSALIYSGKTKQAIKFYDQVEKEIGINEAISITKHKIYLYEEKPDKAADEIERLIKAYPDQTDYYGMLAEVYMKSGQSEKALETYERAIEINPSDPFIQLSLAEYYERENQPDKADVYLHKAFGNQDLDIDTKVTILLRLYRMAEQDMEIRTQALELCKILAQTHPENPKAASVYGDFLYLDEQWRNAREQYETAISMDPSKFVIWTQLLILDSELSDEKSMLAHSVSAMEYFPAQPTPYFFNGLANNQLENYSDAVESLEAGIELVIGNPSMSAQMLASMGDAYHELGNHPKSDSAYELSLEFDPENLYVMNNYSYFLALRGEKLDKALEMSSKTIQKEPNSASYLDTYGWILFKAGNYKEARKYLQQSLEHGGDNSGEVLEHMGDTLFKLNKKDEALEFWKRAKSAGDASENIDAKIESGNLGE